MTKIKNMLKKGFTLVELAIVIAVIAILIAVLVPTFIALIDSANESRDTQMIYNVNQALLIDNSNINTVSDALDVAAEAGYNIDKLTPSSDGEIVYDHATKSFALISTEREVIYPTSNSSLDLSAPTTYYFVDEATYTALNTTASASASSYSLAKTTVKSATDEPATGTTPKEHTASYVATGEWTGAFEYTGMGAIDTTRAKGITSVSYTSQRVDGYDYKLNVAYYIAESSADNYSLTVTITESVDYTIYTSVASNVVFNISVPEDSTINIVEANENAAPALCDENTIATLTITINGTDVTKDYVVETNDNAVVENGVLQLGTEKYPWLIASESNLEKIAYGGYCKVATAKVTSSSALNVASGTEAILDLYGNTLTISGTTTENRITANIINNGTLIITDSSTAKNGSLVVSATNGIYNNGTLTIEGGTITATGSTYALQISSNSGTVAIFGVKITGAECGIILTVGSTDVTIENVTIEDCSSDGIEVNAFGNEEGKVYINNCTVTAADYALSLSGNVTVDGDDGTYTSSGNYALYVFNDNSNVTVNSGTFTGTGGAVYTENSSTIKITISGGTFTGEIKVGRKTTVEISGGTVNGNITLLGNSSAKATMTISGGSFDGTLTNSGTLTITGGKFTADPSSYLASGYTAPSKTLSNKTWYIVTATETNTD